MSGSVSGGHTRSKGRSTTSVRVPKFLRPLARQSATTGQGALTSLTDMLNNDQLVADFTGPQDLAHLLGTGRALGGGGFFPTAQDTILGAAGGDGLDLSFLQDDARTALTDASSGSDGLGFIPPEVLDRLSQTGTGAIAGGGILDDLSRRSGVPQEAIAALMAPGADSSGLLEQILADGTGIDRSTLEATARGDFLAGGQGFDEAVAAAVRAAKPGLISTFGRSGSGGATGGLAQTAIAQSAIDAFARQFAGERTNQLGAANRLADLDLAERGQDAGIASNLADIGLTERNQDIDAASILGQLGLADTGQQGDFAQALAALGLRQGDQELAGLNSLTSLFGDERGRQLSSAELLSQLGADERINQLNAAQAIPGIATADLDLLESIGLSRQNQNQRTITAPIEAQLQLLMASMGVPSGISPFLGSGTSNRSFSHFGKASFGSGVGGFGGGGG